MKRKGYLICAVAFLLFAVGLLFAAALRETGGEFSYPLDDTYIHLALAKNIASQGVYGVTPHEFSAASSSIVWPWLLALCSRFAGEHLFTPLLLNLVLGGLFPLVFAYGFDEEAPHASPKVFGFWLFLSIVAIPLPTMVMLGMEHTLHILITLLFVTEASRVLEVGSTRGQTRLLMLAMALTATRYEGLFLVAIASLLSARRIKFSLALLLSGCAPVVLFGWYSAHHGGLWLPNSVILKGRHYDWNSVSRWLGGDLFLTLWREPHLLTLTLILLGLLALSVRRSGYFSRDSIRLFLSAGATLAHVQFASTGWLFRYEAYVVALDVVSIGLTMAKWSPFPSTLFRNLKQRAPLCALALGIVTTALLIRRGALAAYVTPLACRNIFEQQVQSARFLERYFPNEVVAVNDVGAVAYFGQHRIVDLMGLSSLAVAKAKGYRIDRPLTTRGLDTLTKDVRVAVIYDEWFQGVLPATWVRAGRLTISSNKVCAFPTVSIYATKGEAAAERVAGALRDFAGELPKGVRWVARAGP